jgi:branched-chain amino acid transport system ATP-binding protein
MSSPALSIERLQVAYGAIEAVRGISLQVGQGEAVAVIGSNGAGKTSMLRGVLGLVPARAAAIRLFGDDCAGRAPSDFAHLGVGYVPEGRMLFGGLTVEEELLLGLRLLPLADRPAQLASMYSLFPRLSERRGQVARTLSGGEQQMVAIARILAFRPRLLILDEPSLGLAPVIQDVVYDALARLKESGLSLLLVEQNAFRALNLCDRAYVLEHGEITKEGPAAALMADPGVQTAFLGA